MLGLEEAYRVAEVSVGESDWLANETPAAVDLADEGVLLLGIQRGESYIGAPDSETAIRPGDTVVLYGKQDRLQELSERHEDDAETHDAVEEHEELLESQGRLLEQ